MAEPARRAGRLLYIDNLRWSAISMVVVLHAAVTYSGVGSWYFYDRAGTSRPWVIFLASYESFQHAVAMGLLFGIAGHFAADAVVRKGPAGFLRERCFRLGLPLLLYALLIGPMTQYFIVGSWHGAFPVIWWRHIANGAVFSESGPLWFCLVLLVFSFAFAATGPNRPPRRLLSVPGVAAVLGFAALIAGVTFAIGLLVPPGRVVLNLVVHDLPQYPLMFAAGVLACRHGWLARIPGRAGRAWLLGGLIGAPLLWYLLITRGGALDGRLALYGGGWHWQAAGMDAWRALTCVALTIGLVTLYRDRFDRQGAVSRFLTRNAFGVYVFHPPILIAITRVLTLWPIDAALKFAVASLLAVGTTFLFVGMIARRTPGLRAIL